MRFTLFKKKYKIFPIFFNVLNTGFPQTTSLIIFFINNKDISKN